LACDQRPVRTRKSRGRVLLGEGRVLGRLHSYCATHNQARDLNVDARLRHRPLGQRCRQGGPLTGGYGKGLGDVRRRAGCGDEVGARAVALRQPLNLEAIKLARSAQALAGSRNLVVFPGLGGVLVPRRSAGIQGNTRPLLGLGLAQQVAPVRRDALTFARWRGGHVAPVSTS